MSNIDNKIDLYRAISENTGMQIKDIKKFYEGFIDTIYKEIDKGDDNMSIHLPHLGKLHVKVKEPYEGTNPRTMEKIYVPASRRAYIKLFKQFTSQLNKRK